MVSISGGSGVTEGGNAVFTLTASPAPAANLDVTVGVSQSGDFASSTSTKTVTIPTGGSATLTVGTTNDNVDEADGSVTATVNSGAGYTVGSASAATINVADDDVPPPSTPVVTISGGSGITEGGNAVFTLTASPAPAANLDVTVAVSQSGDFTSSTGTQTVTIPTTGSATLTVGTTNDNVDEADGSVTATVNSGSGYTVGSAGAATINVADDDIAPPSTPVVSISGGSGITEGGNAVFTLTASPAPAANLDVTVAVSQSGDFASSTGTKTVTIPTTGSATLTVGTTNDNVDEADGSVTATVNSGSGYTVGSAGAATINVADDDVVPPSTPEISISGGNAVTEGGNAVFTLTASPAPAANLDVTVSVSQSGNFATTGTQTVTIPTTGSATLSIATNDDSADEADGSVTATVSSGAGYTVSSTANAATVNVSDNDVPEISIAGGSGITEGADALFTLTASPAPHAALSVTVSVSQSGDYASSAGTKTVSIPTTGSATLTVGTDDDSADETDGSVTATVDSGSGYTVGSANAATISVADNDPLNPHKQFVKPTVGVTAGPDIVEGQPATFTFTSTPPTKVKLTISIRHKGEYLQSGGEDRHFTIPASGTATLSEITLDDDVIEDDGSITVYIYWGRNYIVGDNWKATLKAADNDTASVDTREPRTDITWADFWAPYEDLIQEVTEFRNDPLLVISTLHTNLWDRVLLAFGREVEDQNLQAMSVEEAEIRQQNNHQKFDRVAPAIREIQDEVDEHGPWPVNPGDPPEQTTAFPAHIAITGGVTFKRITLTDYFSDPEDQDLTFTASITGTTMSATINGDELTLSLNTGLSRGGGDLTVTASDGQLTDTATAHVVVGCGRSATWNEAWGFCTAAATNNSFSGGADGDTPSQADFDSSGGNHVAQVIIEEGETSGKIRVLVYPDVLNDGNSSNDSTCRMRGYLTIQDADHELDTSTNLFANTELSDGATKATGTWTVRVTGAGFVTTAGAANQQGNADMLTGIPGNEPGWNDASCGNAAVTAHKARLAIVEYSGLPADDGKPGSELNGIKLFYTDIGSSGTTPQRSNELMEVRIKDSISKVTHPAGSRTDLTAITINEGTGDSAGFTISSDDRLVGYLAVTVNGGKPNVRPDLTTNTSNPQHGWWTEADGSSDGGTYFHTSTVWAHLNMGVLPKWTSSGTYGVSTGVWHKNALWIRGASGDYDAGDVPGGSNDGWAPVRVEMGKYNQGYAGSNNGGGRDTPAPVPAWSPTGNYPVTAISGTDGSTGLIWNEHDKKLYARQDKEIGFFAPVDNFEQQRLAAYRDNGPAMRLNLKLTGGGKWPFLDDQACRFAVYGGTKAAPATATCLLNYNWANNGYHGPDQKIEFWWVETDGYDVHAPVKYRTRLAEWTLRETRVGGSIGPSAHAGNYWIEFQNLRGSGYSATNTQWMSESHPDYVNRGDHVSGYIVTDTNPIQSGGNNDRVVAVEVQHHHTAAGVHAQFKNPMNNYVGRKAFTIDGQAHREFYLQSSKHVPCNVAGFDYSCFGGEGNWKKVSGQDLWRVPINLVVHDDNYVGEKLRYYRFSVKDSTSSTNPILEVKEDDHLQITLKADLAINGKMHIHSHRASYQHYSFRLEERGSVDGETGWDQWDVTIERDWHGFASSYHLGDDTKGVDEHPGCPNSGAGWVRAVFENWDGLFYGVDFDPRPSPSDHNYQPDDSDTRYSGWVQVCK